MTSASTIALKTKSVVKPARTSSIALSWPASALAGGIDVQGDEGFCFEEKAFLALFASLAVDLGIVFLTIIRTPRRPKRPPPQRAAQGEGRPTPPRLSSILAR